MVGRWFRTLRGFRVDFERSFRDHRKLSSGRLFIGNCMRFDMGHFLPVSTIRLSVAEVNNQSIKRIIIKFRAFAILELFCTMLSLFGALIRTGQPFALDRSYVNVVNEANRDPINVIHL